MRRRRLGGILIDSSEGSVSEDPLLEQDVRLELPALLQLEQQLPDTFVDDDLVFDADVPEVDPNPPLDQEGFAIPRRKKYIKRVDQEIRQLQNAQERMIMRLPFARLVKEVTVNVAGTDPEGEPRLSWHLDALNALHEAAENYLVELFEDSTQCSAHAKRKTLFREDMQLVRRLRGK